MALVRGCSTRNGSHKKCLSGFTMSYRIKKLWTVTSFHLLPISGSLRHSQPVMPLEESGAWDSQSLDGRLPMMNGMSLPRQGTKDMMQPLLAPSGQRSKSASSQALPQTGPMFPNQQFSSEFAHWATVKSPRMIEDDEVSQCIKQKRGAFAGKGDMFTASAAEFNPDLIVRHPRTASFGYHDQQVRPKLSSIVSWHATWESCREKCVPCLQVNQFFFLMRFAEQAGAWQSIVCLKEYILRELKHY